MKLSQGKLVLGFRTGNHVGTSEFYPMLMFNEIYGASPVSKLFMNVRERLGLCYYCSSGYDMYKGVMTVSSGVAKETRQQAEAEILAQWKELQRGNITESEFEAAKRSLTSSYRAISDLPATLESFYAGRDLYGIPHTVAQLTEELSRVTAADVVRVAQDITLDTVYFLYGDRQEEDEDEAELA